MRKFYLGEGKSFKEVTEAEYLDVVGDETIRPYATQVLRGTITIEDIPEEHRETVASIVAKRNERRDTRTVSSAELASMLQEVM